MNWTKAFDWQKWDIWKVFGSGGVVSSGMQIDL